MLSIGLTGSIACGKSTVAQILRDQGIPVLDADQVAREVVAPGSAGLAAVVDHFGPTVLQADGALDRAALRRIIAESPEERRALEGLTHPRIGEAIMGWLAEQAHRGTAAAAVEAALMLETGSANRYDALLVVACEPAQQLARLVSRDGQDEASARKWLSAQMSTAEKVAAAKAHPRSTVVWNRGSRDALVQGVVAALDALGVAHAG